jgi:hypothetical protein
MENNLALLLRIKGESNTNKKSPILIFEKTTPYGIIGDIDEITRENKNKLLITLLII